MTLLEYVRLVPNGALVELFTSSWWGTGNLLPPFSNWVEGQQQPGGAAHLMWALSSRARNWAIHALNGNKPNRWQKGKEKPAPASSPPPQRSEAAAVGPPPRGLARTCPRSG